MKSLQTKLKEKKGFTLAELLIVVAIIAVLVAVSIPIFTAKLNDAKKSTDEANERAAKSAATAEYLGNKETEEVVYIYDATKGVVDEEADMKANTVAGYNKLDHDTVTGENKGVVQVTINSSGTTVTWVAGKTGN